MNTKRSLLPFLMAFSVLTGCTFDNERNNVDVIPRPNYPIDVDAYHAHVVVQRVVISRVLEAVRSDDLGINYISLQTTLRNINHQQIPSENRLGQFISMKLNADGLWYIVDGQVPRPMTMDEALSWFSDAAEGLLDIGSAQILSERLTVQMTTGQGEYQGILSFNGFHSQLSTSNILDGKLNLVGVSQVNVLADGTVVIDDGGTLEIFFPDRIPSPGGQVTEG